MKRNTFTILSCLLSVALFALLIKKDLRIPWELHISTNKDTHVIIGVVICSSGGDTAPREETVALIKSVVISSILCKVSRITFHLFLEHKVDETYFQKLFTELNSSVSDIQLTFVYYDAVNIVTEQYRDKMVFSKDFRCGFVRIFFPNALPGVDSIVYLDTDSIITGNIVDLWQYFEEMQNDQMIGMVMANAAHNPHFLESYRKFFGDIPHPTVKGLVSGLMLMNLTKMREYRVQEKMLRLYDDYSKMVTLDDQKLINVFLYYAEGLLKLIPCQFNFRRTHCARGMFCEEAYQEPHGVQLVHGSSSNFQLGGHFHQLYLQYYKVSIAEGQKDGFTNMMMSIRKAYEKNSPHKTVVYDNKSQCFGVLNKALFRNFQQLQ